MSDILCPNCGMPNPDDQNICSFCRQPLRVAADDEAIHPGDMPTKKATAELEPILPQWLRDARSKSRENAEETQAEQAAAEASKPAQESPKESDWLAGLEAAAKDEGEEDIPDWMRGIAPAKPAPATPKHEQPPKAEETYPRRQEISWEEEPAPATPPPTGPLGAVQSEDGIPYWLKNMEEEAPAENQEVADFLAKQEEPPVPPQGNISPFENGTFRPNTGELINWLNKMSPQVGEPAPSMPGADQPASEPLPDWVSKLESEPAEAETSAPAADSFNFDWLKEEASKPFTPFQSSQAPQESAPVEEPAETSTGLPDWMQPGAAAPQEPAPAPQEEAGAPDWLNTMSAETPAETAAPSDVPDWLKSLPEIPTAAEPSKPPDAPDWMQSFAAESALGAASTPSQAGEELPQWAQPAREEPAPKADEASAFDWMQPAAPSQTPQEIPPVQTPAFVPGEEPVQAGQADDLFAVNMPDWLSGIAPAEAAPSLKAAQKSEAPQEEIAPAELPSWVQAMRPVEAALPDTAAVGEPSSQPAETQGPLAGLRDVLPAVLGSSTSGKPKIYSIRLEPTADQQQHAALLEQMLESETQAKPMRMGAPLLGAQRVLRWVVTAILFLIIAFLLFTQLKLTPPPVVLSPESELAFNALNATPNDAPVLLVFDYEPALSGELEAAGASFLNGLTELHNPRYTLLSTSPTGAALAEHFRSRSNFLLADRVVDLGYLPGEASGVYAFALNPRAAKPANADGSAAWVSTVSQDVHAYSDFALVVLLTDRAESARMWVEQTATRRNGRPLVVISSAQAAPMIQPYLISGQVSGLVSGLHGGAEFEGRFGKPGAAVRYWDAFNLSKLTAVILIFLGGMWNLALGLRARRQEQADA